MGTSGVTCRWAVAVEAERRGKKNLVSVVVAEGLHTEEKTHPDASMVVVDG